MTWETAIWKFSYEKFPHGWMSTCGNGLSLISMNNHQPSLAWFTLLYLLYCSWLNRTHHNDIWLLLGIKHSQHSWPCEHPDVPSTRLAQLGLSINVPPINSWEFPNNGYSLWMIFIGTTCTTIHKPICCSGYTNLLNSCFSCKSWLCLGGSYHHIWPVGCSSSGYMASPRGGPPEARVHAANDAAYDAGDDADANANDDATRSPVVEMVKPR